MTAPLLLPVVLFLGISGSRMALDHRLHSDVIQKPRERWFFLTVLWSPTLVWILAQFVRQG